MTHSTAQAAQHPPIDIRIESANHYVRPLEPSDASERACAWFGDADNARLLNRPAQALTLDQFREYVASHDRISGHVLGIFDKASDTLVGFWSVYIDWELREFLISVIVGERGAISRGARAHTQLPLVKFLFNDLNLETVRFAALTQNARVVGKFRAEGSLEPEHTAFAPSPSTEAFVEIQHYRVSKEAWRELRARIDREAADRAGA